MLIFIDSVVFIIYKEKTQSDTQTARKQMEGGQPPESHIGPSVA